MSNINHSEYVNQAYRHVYSINSLPEGRGLLIRATDDVEVPIGSGYDSHLPGLGIYPKGTTFLVNIAVSDIEGMLVRKDILVPMHWHSLVTRFGNIDPTLHIWEIIDDIHDI